MSLKDMHKNNMPVKKSIYQGLSFPLNVYATLLQLDNIPVDYLHFGLFQFPGEDVYAAQQHSTDKILQHLPPAPGKILEIGMGLGTLQRILQEKGYQPQGLTPDQAQYDIALKNISQNTDQQAHIHCTGFENFTTMDHFKVIISQESAQYIDILDLLPKVASLIDPGGYFIVIDEVSINPQQAGIEALHQPAHLEFLAQSVGLTLQHEEDLSASAKYTMEYLQARLTEHRTEILALIDNDQAQFTQLVRDIDRYINNYEQQCYGYRLMVFVKSKETSNTIHYLNETHAAECQKLFHKAYEQSMDTQLWQWKYQPGQTPAQSHAIGYWHKSQLAGYYGGFVRAILFFGQPQKAILIGDSIATQKVHDTMTTKDDIFHQLARIFLQRFIGYGAPYLLGFGFPNSQEMKLAETLKLYGSAGRIVRLSWQAIQLPIKPLYKIRPLTSEQDKTAIDTLWMQMAHDTHEFIIGVRDWQRIDYRYRQHPEQNYIILKIEQRFSNKLIALLVLKKYDAEFQLIDFVCSLKNIPLVVYAALRFCQSHDQATLFAHISENIKPFFNTYPYSEDDPQISIPHSICTPGPTLASVNNKWWLMAGDSDFM